MKFKSFKGKQVMAPKGVIRFRSTEYETTNKDEIEALKNAKDVSPAGGKAQEAKDEK